ncbi:MAG: Hpt domain-containing protein, partial [Desulfobacterales bacterium]|nr:Hpt domain-containing protein [Desulfobacterales bacterium]
MDGHTATRHIRDWEQAQEPHASLPIIAMTAHAMAGDSEKSLAAGMNGHVTKPIDPAQLFAELAKWVTSGSRVGGERQAAESPAPDAAPPEADLPETLTGFDIAEGLSRLQGNRQLYRKLILSFADSCREGIAQIRNAIAEENCPEVLHQAHSIKGSSANLAAKDVQAAAMALERLVKDHPQGTPSTDALNAAFESLNRVAHTLFVSVEAIAGAPEDDVAAEADITASIPTGDLASLASRIKDAAEMGDMTELQTIAADLDAQYGDKQTLSRKIADLADDFDLDGLGELAEELVAD